MDPEVTLRELVRYLVAGQHQMADLIRIAHNVVQGRDGDHAQKLIAEWNNLERRCAGGTCHG
jgi:hypothetical protein